MEKIRIGNVCDILNGYAFKSENYASSGVRIIRISNVQKGYIEDTTPAFYPIETADLDRFMLEQGDLLMSLTGNVGRVAILGKELLPAALNQRVACLRLKSDKISKNYLFHILNSNFFEQQCIMASKGVAQKNLSTEWLKDYEIPLYEGDQQEKIVMVLSTIQSVISKRKHELQKLDELVKARFVEMFGDYIKGRGKQLSELATITGGLTKSSKRDTFKLKMPYLRVANVFFNRLDLNEILEIGVREEEVEKTLLQTGDLLFVEGNGSIEQIGRVAIWDGSISPILHQNHLIKARFNDRTIIPEFALFYFMSEEGRQQIISKSVSTSGLNTLSVNKIGSLILPVPPIPLQEQFSAFVKQTDKSKAVIQKALDEAQVLFDSLMQKYFG